MNKTLLTVLLTSAAFAGAPGAGVEEAVKAAEKSWADAVVKGDTATLGKMLADDIVYTHSDTRPETKMQIIDGFKSGETKINGVEFADSRYRQYGDTVLANHKITIDNAKTGKLTLFVTHVWVKQHGAWQLANRQTTRYPAK